MDDLNLSQNQEGRINNERFENGRHSSSLISYLIKRRLFKNEEQALRFIFAFIILLVLLSIYFIAKSSAGPVLRTIPLN